MAVKRLPTMALAALLLNLAALVPAFKFTGLSTYFKGCGKPYCGCGVPEDMLVDDNGRRLPFVALNMHHFNEVGEFNRGRNCGRVIKMTVGNGCTGGSNTAWKICRKGGDHGIQNYDKRPDAIAKQNRVLYGVVSDSCADTNYWCRASRYHLDISMRYLISVFGSIGLWNNRYVSWEYMDGAPPGWSMTRLNFAWGVGGTIRLNYLPLIIANTPDGIRSVDVQMRNGEWVKSRRNGFLGNQWSLAHGKFKWGPGGRIKVRIISFNNRVTRPYGQYWVSLPPGVQRVVKFKAIPV